MMLGFILFYVGPVLVLLCWALWPIWGKVRRKKDEGRRELRRRRLVTYEVEGAE